MAEKRNIVEQALEAGACVAEIARQHGINDNLVFNWRKLYLAGRLGEVGLNSSRLLPVKVAEEGYGGSGLASGVGTISIQLSKVQIRIEGKADAHTLAVVLEHVLR